MPSRGCSIEDCERPHKGRGYCATHLSRLKIHGDPLKGAKGAPGGPCSVLDCEGIRIAKGFCQKHYNRDRRNGSPLDEHQAYVLGHFTECTFCGGPIPEDGPLRRYCRRACASAVSAGAVRPSSRPCARCGTVIDFTERTKSGRLLSSSTLLCKACARPAHLRKHVPELLERDGSDCRICGIGIDLSLRFPDPMSRSVDHIQPRSLGGADDISNYQLAHLGCNSAKKNRAEVDLAP